MKEEETYGEDAEIRRIGRALSGLFVPPKGLDERIMGAVRQRTPSWKGTRISVWRSPWLRYAASVAVLAVLAGIIMHVALRTERLNGDLAAAERMSLQKLRLDGSLPRQGDEQNEQGKRMPLRLAGVSSPLVSSSGGGKLHVAIAPELRHVWIVPDLEKAERLLRQIGQANEKKMLSLEKNDGRMIYSVTLSDAEVQSLVNLLHKENWSLVSPGYPQPMEEYNAVFTGKAVDYEIQIVRQQ